jgi:putative DNA methylase
MKKKLIEVALPLEAINRESVRENYIYRGNPSAIHKWWAQRPLAAARAVILASLLNDPSSERDRFPTKSEQEQERKRLFKLIERFVTWENSETPDILAQVRDEITRATGGHPPEFLDPFSGAGSIPLEAQRLGLRVRASDLNPMAVLTTKAVVELPAKVAGIRPINPEMQIGNYPSGSGSRGLSEDIRYYGRRLREDVERSVGQLYPKVKNGNSGEDLSPIAWLWARTVSCPNPACGTDVPLIRSFQLSKKAGSRVFLHPEIDRKTVPPVVTFTVQESSGTDSSGTVTRRGAKCLCCDTAISLDYVRAEGRAGRIRFTMLAVVAIAGRKRVYITPSSAQIRAAEAGNPEWVPSTSLPEQALGFRVQAYGMLKHSQLFTNRQLAVLSSLYRCVRDLRTKILEDASRANLRVLTPQQYADIVTTYLALACDKVALYNNALVRWYAPEDRPSMLFERQTISMLWDFAEVNPFSEIGGSIAKSIEVVADALPNIPGALPAEVNQQDARTVTGQNLLVSTDPPYYDNVPYADLSDFFYVWLRHALQGVYPDLFSTLLTPKAQELIAEPFRHGGQAEAEEFFREGLSEVFCRLHAITNPEFPVTVYYAFKQSETKGEDDDGGHVTTTSTGWETILSALLSAEFSITGTWPMRTERAGRLRDTASNALASSIVLVCRPRPADAGMTSRKDFVSSLRRELPEALREMQQGNIAPVDLAQAAIGPGMAVFSRYRRVLETDGSVMQVRTALALINQTLDEVLSEQESEFDPDTRWALAWFEQHQFDEGAYGEAEVLATAKALSISHLAGAGILHSRAGKVRLLRREELPEGWDPSTIERLTVWDITQHLIRSLDQKGEQETANLKARIGGMAEIARDLAYRLYTLCERKGWAEEAGYYNSLVVAWPSMASEAFELN